MIAPTPLTLWRKEILATLALGFPLMSAQLTQMVINVTNTLVIGHLGANELAASVLGWQLFFVIWIFGNGFCFAVMPLAAGSLGSGDARGIGRYARMGLWLSLAYALAVMPLLWHSDYVFRLLGQDAHISALAGAYVRVLQWSLFPQLAIILLRSVFSALHRPAVIVYALIGGAVCNAALNLLLVFGHWGLPALGMNGAALATVVSMCVVMLCLLVYAGNHQSMREHRLLARFFYADLGALKEIFRLGWPIGTTIVAEVGLFSATSVMMGWLSPYELAAHGIALQLVGLSFMIPLGLSGAATIRVGWAHGKGLHASARHAAIAAVVPGLCISCLTALAFVMIPEVLIGFYLDMSDPASHRVLPLAVAFLAVGAAFQLVDALQALASGALRGLKDTRIPMVLALISYWLLGLPAAYGLAFMLDMGGTGIWWGLALGLFCAAASLSVRLVQQLRTCSV